MIQAKASTNCVLLKSVKVTTPNSVSFSMSIGSKMLIAFGSGRVVKLTGPTIKWKCLLYGKYGRNIKIKPSAIHQATCQAVSIAVMLMPPFIHALLSIEANGCHASATPCSRTDLPSKNDSPIKRNPTCSRINIPTINESRRMPFIAFGCSLTLS